MNGTGGNVSLPGRRGPRHPGGSRAKDILNQVKSGQMSRPPYADGAQVKLSIRTIVIGTYVSLWFCVAHAAQKGVVQEPCW